MNRNNIVSYPTGEPPRLPQNNTDNIYTFKKNEEIVPSSKRRKFSSSAGGNSRGHYPQYPVVVDNAPSTSTSFLSAPVVTEEKSGFTGSKRDRDMFDDEVVFLSRDEIERLSPSRKDGIDTLRETYLRYSYCAFLQNLGMRLELYVTFLASLF